MANSVRVSTTRKITNKLADGSFDATEIGGEFNVEVDVEGTEELGLVFNALFEELKAQVDAKLGSVQTAPPVAETQDEESEEEEKPAEKDKLARWVKDTVDKNTSKVRDRVMPGEKFKKPPAAEAPKVTTADITEGEAVAFDNVNVYLDNSQTKMGKTTRGKKFSMLRLGKRGEIPGDYVTGKSFEPDVVEQMEEIIDKKIKNVDVYGFFEARNNDPDLFDLVIQGIAEAS